MTSPTFVGVGAPSDPLEATGNRMYSGHTGPPGGSRQKQTFKLTHRVAAAWRAARFPEGSQPVDTDPTTLDSGTSSSGRTFAWQEYFKVDNTRLQTYEDVKEMDETTDEVSAALDIIADSAVNPEDGSQHTFIIEIDEGPYRDQAEEVFDQVTESLDLHRQAFSIARDFIKFGDCFLELVVDDAGRLARAKILPAGSIWRNEDAAGNMRDGSPDYDREGHCTNPAGDCAYDQREGLNGRIMAAFYAWQITHFRWNLRGSERYGRSMLRTARLVWKKLRASEEALVIARLQRAWMRFVHYIDTTGMPRESARAALQQYRQELTRRYIVDTQLRESPFEVTSDFYLSSGYLRDLDGNKYLPKQAKIEVLQGDHAVLAAIHDIEYFQNKLFASLRVPKAYLGFERDINAKATLTTQDIQFARLLRRVQAVLSHGYKEIFDFALLLAGIDPTQVTYAVRWPAILVSDEERDAIIRMYHARADATYWQMGGPSTKYLVQQRYGFDDEAWEIDLREAAHDPPMRLKPSMLGMPSPQNVQGTGDQTMDAAIAGNADIRDVTDDPADAFAMGRVTSSTAARAAQTSGGKNATRRRSPRMAVREEDAEEGAEGLQEGLQEGDDPEALEDGGFVGDDDGDIDDVGWAPGLQPLFDPDLGYDPDYVHGLGAPTGAGQGARPARRVFVPGRAARSASARLDGDGQGVRNLRRLQSVPGVHGARYQAPGSQLPQGSARVRGAAARELEALMTDLAARKMRASARTAPGR